ncbi:adenylosuccinate synthetase [Nannocystis punicea]|uniref:Adenylosuccinate synthetase n=1 Tax=Nannocystis punicea TaxID=2995304 RepID=A0ABY7H0B5_9BACT|nr:adenylosuccinate synthetase [Nannocystis poenicansa]WAS92570.1 adenylosuccinate synthetase [Nannocystis poenicansa]
MRLDRRGQLVPACVDASVVGGLALRTCPEGPVAVLGCGFGDEGKGAVVDALARARAGGRRPLVVRFNGGPQAAHHVVDPEGRVHCFAQFGAGALAGARSCLSRFMLVEPLALAREADVLCDAGLADPWSGLVVDRRCAVVTPFHRLLGRIEELSRGTARHGSCGLGVGPAWRDAHNPHAVCLRVGALTGDRPGLVRVLRQIQLLKLDRAEQLAEAASAPAIAPLVAELARPDLADVVADAYLGIAARLLVDEGEQLRAALQEGPEAVIFEGAHGALLDADRGFFPFVTPSAVSFAQAEALCAEVPSAPPLRRLGVLRAYGTRHGPGPFVAEDPSLDLPESHNLPGPWQGPMRVGWFDLVAARLGLAIAGRVDGLVVTHLDRLAGRKQISVCDAWSFRDGAEVRDFVPATGSLESRAEATRALAEARPSWRRLLGWNGPDSREAGEFLDFVALELGVRIAATAWGPRASDQRGWSAFEERDESGKRR